MANKYLINARNAREEGNSEDAKKFYDMVRTEEPDNGEAKFFYTFYSLYEGKNGELAMRFERLCKIIKPSFDLVAKSEDSKENKIAMIRQMADTFIPETWSFNRYMNNLTVGSGSERHRVLPNSDIESVCKNGVMTLYSMGDEIEKLFPGDEEALKIAADAWKEAVTLQQKWYAYFDKSLPEKYAAKIKRVDPAYVMPEKAGCIQWANKK